MAHRALRLALLVAAASSAVSTPLVRFSLDAQVALRFASTTVTLAFNNTDGCTRVETLRIQKPRGAKISALLLATDDCVTAGEVVATPDVERHVTESAAHLHG